MIVLEVMVAGACGAVLRYLVDHLVQRRAGSDVPGGHPGHQRDRLVGPRGPGRIGPPPRGLGTWLTVAGTGLIGAYTTFSTFTFDSVRLAEADRWALSLVNVAAGIALGLGAAALGLAVGSAI